MDVRIHAIYQVSYLNILSEIMKQLGLPQLLDRLVPVDPQCQTRSSDIVQLILLDILSGRQALVHLEEWAGQIDLEKLIREGLLPSQFNDDTIARHFLLALVVYRVFQRRVRQVITNERPLKGAGKRKLTKPTGQAIFQLFAYVQVVVLEWPNGQRQRKLGRPLTYEQQRVLRELGFGEEIYL
jgi:hypothetical protein